MIQKMLQWASRASARVDIATAYFNIAKTYMPLLMQSSASVRIVTASPRVSVVNTLNAYRTITQGVQQFVNT
jgi:ATP phosphoribosyltransferase